VALIPSCKAAALGRLAMRPLLALAKQPPLFKLKSQRQGLRERERSSSPNLPVNNYLPLLVFLYKKRGIPPLGVAFLLTNRRVRSGHIAGGIITIPHGLTRPVKTGVASLPPAFLFSFYF